MIKIRCLTVLMILSIGTILFSCQDDDYEFGEIKAPSGLSVEANVLNTSEEFPHGDGSGEVEFEVHAENAVSYEFNFGDNTTITAAEGITIHQFRETGTKEYVVTVKANGKGGVSTTETVRVTVFSAFDDPQTKRLLTGATEAFLEGEDSGGELPSKTWYVAAALPAHLGVGPAEGTGPNYYSAAPFEKEFDGEEEGCFYDDALTFSLNENRQLLFEQDNQGTTFFNAAYNSVGGGDGPDDQCLPYDASGVKSVSMSSAGSEMPEEETTGTQITIGDGGFMSYFLNTSSYEIIEITEDFMEVRAKMGPGGDPALAWYIKFTTDPDGGSGSGGGNEPLVTQFETLVWSDEFDQGASPDTSIWNYETGNNNGWGNGEAQYYTQDNAVIEGGTLKINAIAESISGFNYSSSRITTQDNYEFQYGRIEVRAKLPEGGGTWPAIWMLGSNIDQVGWPASGEIDNMEYVGNEPGVVHGSLHFPGNSAGNAVTESTLVENPSSEFHDYTVEWTEEHILFAVDNMVYHEFNNSSNTPFHQPFFIILNVAMGGTLGGTIESDFQQATMEIDYVRVYQE